MKIKIWIYFGLLLIIIIGLIATVKQFKTAGEKTKRRREIETFCSKVAKDETIFVSIPSYRDPECARTIFECFEHAACPWRIHIGVCQQNAPGDIDCTQKYKYLAKTRGISDFSRNLRVYSISASDARGPMYARALIEEHLYRDEKYYLIIDSHTTFCKNWDQRVIDNLLMCDSEKPVLTMYPTNFQFRTSHDFGNENPCYLRFKKWNKDTGLPEIEGPMFDRKPRKPTKTSLWAACFSFGYATQIKEVPYDKNYPYAFFGEEISMAVRLWTHGYDLYTPSGMFVKHMWTRQGPVFWELFNTNSKLHRKRNEQHKHSNKRLRRLFGLQTVKDPEKEYEPEFQFTDLKTGKYYGLGFYRSLQNYEHFSGIYFETQVVKPYARLGVAIDAEEEHIILKFGSLQKYHKLLKMCQ